MRAPLRARILTAMQTGDTWAAWRRASRFAARGVIRSGVSQPAALLCLGMAIALGTAHIGWVALGQLQNTLAFQAQAYVELQPSASDQDVQEFYAAAQELPAVSGVQLVSKQQALDMQRERHPDLAAFLDRYQLQNPFADAFQLRLRSASGFAELRTFLQNERWSTLLDPGAAALLAEQEESLVRLQGIVDLLGRTGAYLGVLLLLAALAFMTDMALSRLTERRMERRTVLLLGGGWVESDGTVAMEMTLLLWGAFLLAAVVLGLGIAALPQLLSTDDVLLKNFLAGVQQAALSSFVPALLTALLLVPCAVLTALFFARLRLPLRHV